MIDYEEDWLIKLIFRYRGSVVHRASLFALPSTLLTLGLLIFDDHEPEFRRNANFMDFSASTLWGAGTAAIVFIIAFRTNRAILRFWEGTGLLHQMRGEWFDTVSNCVSFSIKASRTRENYKKVMEFRHTLVRLMSLCHGYALEEVSGNEFEIGTIDVYGLDRATRRYLKECHENFHFNKVEMTLHLIQSLIVNANLDGLIDVPAPILSRVFQTISRGFVHLLNTKKITDTKFPFPYTQLIAIMLFWFSFFTPVIISSMVVNKTMAALCTFVPVFAMSGLNFIAIEVENPFGTDDNDLPMAHFQNEMDSCLLMLLHPFADTVPTVGHACIHDFDELFDKYGCEGKQKEEPDDDNEEIKERQKGGLRRWDTREYNVHNERSMEIETYQRTSVREAKDTGSGKELAKEYSNESSEVGEACDSSKVRMKIEEARSLAAAASEDAPSEVRERVSVASAKPTETDRLQCLVPVGYTPPQHISVEVQTVTNMNVEVQTDAIEWLYRREDMPVNARIAPDRQETPKYPRVMQLGQPWRNQVR